MSIWLQVSKRRRDIYRYKVFVCDVKDVGAKSKDFNNLSGKYTMELIVGDAVIENPITWLMVSELWLREFQFLVIDASI